jgi:hypothetical protein
MDEAEEPDPNDPEVVSARYLEAVQNNLKPWAESVIFPDFNHEIAILRAGNREESVPKEQVINLLRDHPEQLDLFRQYVPRPWEWR